MDSKISIGTLTTKDDEFIPRLHRKVSTVQEALGHFIRSRRRIDCPDPPQCRRLMDLETVKDGDKLTIDYVLVCTGDQLKSAEMVAYLKNLDEAGIESHVVPGTVFCNLLFVQLSVTNEALSRYAHIHNTRFRHRDRHCETHGDQFVRNNNAFDVNLPAHVYQRLTDSPETGVTEAERIIVAYNVLEKTAYGQAPHEFGVESLRAHALILAHYPLHDGPHELNCGPLCYRQVLNAYWCNNDRIVKLQPLDTIERYFGAEIALYFAWFGFYIRMLIVSSLAGVLFFVVGCLFYPHDRIYVEEVCASDAILCPMCRPDDRSCEETLLNKYCNYARANYFVDNPSTITFAIFMSFWSVVYYEFWKRKEAMLKLRWNLMMVDADYAMRPEYVRSTRWTRLNAVTGNVEPYVPLVVALGRYALTVIVCALLILLIIISILLIILYRVLLNQAIVNTTNYSLQKLVHFLSGFTSAVVTVIMIKLLAVLIRKVTLWLTDNEMHRTQVQHENAYVYKLWILSFFNYYLPVIYIAFIKGRFFDRPDSEPPHFLLRSLQLDKCPPTGCLMSLSIQIILILLIKEVSVKLCEHRKMLKKARAKIDRLPASVSAKLRAANAPQWEKDFVLLRNRQSFLASDYVEIVLQYGLVAFFAAATPFAPLVALAYNAVELRLDAKRVTRHYRRPVPRRLPGIGAWRGIMQAITVLGTVVNAFVIGFTSDVVPREVHRRRYGTLSGYVNQSMSSNAVLVLQIEIRSLYRLSLLFNVVSHQTRQRMLRPCYYRGLRHPVDHSQEYAYREQHWIETSARLAVVVIFEHVVLGLIALLAYAIPDIPFSVKERMYQEREKRHTRSSERQSE